MNAIRCPIQDQKAVELARQFYRTLAAADQAQPFDKPATIDQAFEQAMAYLKTKFEVKVEQDAERGIKIGFSAEINKGSGGLARI